MAGRFWISAASAAALVVALAGVSASPAFSGGFGALHAHAAATRPSPAAQILGNPSGDVTIVEFFDYACPSCKAAEPRVEALLKADKGVRLVVNEYPVLSPQSALASRAALAAARQGKYTAFHQQLLLYRGGLDEAAIFGVAQDVGCDLKRLRKDMADPAIAKAIADTLRLAKAVGVQGTPTFIVGDHIITQPSASIDFPALAAARRAHPPA